MHKEKFILSPKESSAKDLDLKSHTAPVASVIGLDVPHKADKSSKSSAFKRNVCYSVFYVNE